MKQKIFKTEFFDKKTQKPIEPIYIWHKAKNKTEAKADAKSFYTSFVSNLNTGTVQMNKLYKNFTVNVIEMQKRSDKKQLADKPANARMFKQVLTSPYYENENGTLKTVFNIRGKAGVYMIYHKGELRYIGLASDIYKTMYHHLGKQVWNNSKQYRAIYKDIENVKVRVIYTKTFEIAKRLEAGLIFKYNPPDNYNTYEDFEPDDKEKEMVNDFLDAKGQPIAQYKGDLPF